MYRKTYEPAKWKITKGFDHSCYILAGIQMPTSSRANKKKPCIAAKTTDTYSCQNFHYASHPGVVSFASPLVQRTVLFARATVWEITPRMSQGRQAASMLGANLALPGKVPSVHSQTWGRCSPYRAGAAAANGIFYVVDVTTLFSPAQTKEFSLSKGVQCPGHPAT